AYRAAARHRLPAETVRSWMLLPRSGGRPLHNGLRNSSPWERERAIVAPPGSPFSISGAALQFSGRHMAQVAEIGARERLQELPARLLEHPGFSEAVQSLLAGHGATLDGVWGSSCALVAAALARHAPQALVVVCPHQEDMDLFADDLALFSSQRPSIFPASERSSGDKLLLDELSGE